MAQHPKRPDLKNIENTGFATSSSTEGERLANKDGSTNLRKTGLPYLEHISTYHTLLRMSRGKFMMVVLLFYTGINLFFAALFYMIGVQHLLGTDSSNSRFTQFMDAFFFSSQTLTTVGYGHVAPTGMLTNSVASVESLLGILIFAVVTGLMYGRFARPRAYLKFSHNILISPYKGGRALMFRVASYKNNNLTDAETQATAALHVMEDGKIVTRFYPLKLEITKINSLALSWTIVCALDEDSPMYNYSRQDFTDSRMEVIVAIKAFDDHFSNIVQQRTSYNHHELVYGAKFLPMFHRAENGSETVLEVDKINAFEKVTLPDAQLNANMAASVAVKL
jgi:inward rectifier potassium channel